MISGSIDPEDPSPQAAAWREIQEETTLTRSSLELMRQGKSYILPDESIGREWTIHPFAFRLKEPSEGGKGEEGINLDWEHEDWAWYDPMEVKDSESFGAVPRLGESLRRVWFEKDLGDEAGTVLTNGLDRLKNDHQSGARQLASTSLQILRDIILAMDAQQSVDTAWTKIRFAAWHIWKNGRESMGAAILSVLLAALRNMEEILDKNKANSSAEWRNVLVKELESRIAARQDAATAISGVFASFLQDQFASRVEYSRPLKVLTLSESSTITHVLRHVAQNTRFSLDLRILESRPLFEGVCLANSLTTDDTSSLTIPAEGGKEPHQTSIPKLRVTMYTDASSALASQDVDLVLLGADRIAESGDVSNKTGSLPAVLSAKHVSPKAKTVIISESEKIAPPGAADAHVVEENDSTQLTHAWKAEFNSERVKIAAGTVSPDGGVVARPSEPDLDDPMVHVDIRNVFFEWVSPELIDAYVTEQGIWTVGDIRKLSETLGIEEERLFRDI